MQIVDTFENKKLKDFSYHFWVKTVKTHYKEKGVITLLNVQQAIVNILIYFIYLIKIAHLCVQYN